MITSLLRSSRVGTAVEHFALYQYQFANTKNIFAGQIQTETAYVTFFPRTPSNPTAPTNVFRYYQPNPPAPIPFPPVPTLNDPIFPSSSSSSSTTNNIPPAEGWALRVVNSDSIRIYGAGLYSFFIDYNNSNAPPLALLIPRFPFFSPPPHETNPPSPNQHAPPQPTRFTANPGSSPWKTCPTS